MGGSVTKARAAYDGIVGFVAPIFSKMGVGLGLALPLLPYGGPLVLEFKRLVGRLLLRLSFEECLLMILQSLLGLIGF